MIKYKLIFIMELSEYTDRAEFLPAYSEII